MASTPWVVKVVSCDGHMDFILCFFCAVQKLEGHLSQREEFTWGPKREVLRFLCHSQSKAKRSDTTKPPPENKLSHRKIPWQKKKSYIQLMLVALSRVSQEAPLCVWSHESSSNLCVYAARWSCACGHGCSRMLHSLHTQVHCWKTFHDGTLHPNASFLSWCCSSCAKNRLRGARLLKLRT